MNYCFHCMAKLEKSGGICPECGYDNRMNTNGIGFLPGCVLNDQYVIGEALGRGGFGITYMGLDLRLNRKVAVKEYFPMSIAVRDPASMTLHPVDKSVREDFDHGIERVMREAGLAASLDAIPNIVRIYNVIQANGTVYIIMEYIKGMTLSQYVQKEGGKLTWLQVWTLLQPVMRALGKIHSLGVVHRDVSPDNIMIREDGTPILLDFGAAQHATTGKTAHSVALRLGFAPLEQFSTNGFQDGRTDQYSMMATMYYALTGQVPNAPLEGDVVLPREYGADIPEKAERILMKGMSRNYQDRYPNMEALMDAFEQASSNEYTRILDEKPSTGSSQNRPERPKATSSSGPAPTSGKKTESTERKADGNSKLDKKGKTTKRIGLAAAFAVLVLLGVMAGRFIWPRHEANGDLSQNAEIYASALEYMASGQYEEAVVLLDWLGDYEGAARQKEIAEKAVEERRLASAYAEARKLEKAGKYDEAKEAYAALGTYSDSADQVSSMELHMRLQEADSLLEKGAYEAAIEIYESLGSFENAPDQKKAAETAMEEQRLSAGYAEAQSYVLSGEYQKALEAFTALGNYRDSGSQAVNMQKHLDLQKADALMAQGQYEAAVEIYSSLGDFAYSEEQKKLAETIIGESSQAAAYVEAHKLEEAGKYEEAGKAYEALGTYMDASDQTAGMQKYLNLQKADTLMAQGQYEQAMEIYSSLGNFAYSEEQKKLAETIIGENSQAAAYIEAHKLEQAGKYEEAGKAYEALGTYMDASDQTAGMQKYLNLQKADALMVQGQYEAAMEIYSSLGDFAYSEEQKKLAETVLGESSQAAAYVEAHKLEQSGKYEEARKAYESLGNYMDAPDQTAAMQKFLRLQQADDLMTQGRYEEAREMYASLEGFVDADRQAGYAQKYIDLNSSAAGYLEARTLEQAGKYAEAERAYAALGSYMDAADQAVRMQKYVSLLKADSLMEQGKYEEAREIYASLGSFENAQEQITLAEEALEERRKAEAYEQAQALEKAEKYEEAQKAYAALGAYRDAEEKAESLSRYKHIASYATVGNIVTFGHYEQDASRANGMEAIEWVVLDVQDGKSLLISRYALDAKAYNNASENITWEKSDLRQWLNDSFLQEAFTDEERSAVVLSNVDNSEKQGYWSTDGGKDTRDHIFLLSYTEANQYLGVNGKTNALSHCGATRYAQRQRAYTDNSVCRWWLRSPGSLRKSAAVIDTDGSLSNRGVSHEDVGVRPAFWLNLNSDIF